MQLASVNAAAAELGTSWPSLRKAFARHGLGMPARNPEAVRQRAIAAARQHGGRAATPTLDPVLASQRAGRPTAAMPTEPTAPADPPTPGARDDGRYPLTQQPDQTGA